LITSSAHKSSDGGIVNLGGLQVDHQLELARLLDVRRADEFDGAFDAG
jgi:hypothetical protein